MNCYGSHSMSVASERIVCLQDGIFSASYSGTTQPFSPAAFLHAWWRHADHHLASYQQQDAHEFYLYALAGLGQSWPEEKAAPASAPVRATSQQQQLSGISFCHIGFECQTLEHGHDECIDFLGENAGTVAQIIWQADLHGVANLPSYCLNISHKASHPQVRHLTAERFWKSCTILFLSLSGMKQDADMTSHSAPQLQRQQELEIKQEAGVASHAAEQQYQLQQTPKQEQKEEECLLVPSQHALHACLAEPLHQGMCSALCGSSSLLTAWA